MPKDATEHRFRFFRAGGFDQVRLDRGEDILALPDLDQKLWVALSCPVHGLEFDEKTLERVDTDNDGRIRAPEILAAVKWAGSVLKSADSLLKRSPALPLAAIDAKSEEGKRLLASAKRILANLGKKGEPEISLDDTTDTAKVFAATRFNGDGIVPAASAEDPQVAKAIEDVIACAGSVVDRSGAPGVSQEKVDAFFVEAEAFASWWAEAEADRANVLPLGERTAAAAGALRAVRTKLDDYFLRARLIAFDVRAQKGLNRDEAEYTAIGARELSASAAEIASFPIARVDADRPLPLRSGINPAWTPAVRTLVTEVVEPVLGDKAELTEDAWRALCERFAAYEAWQARKKGATVEPLGHDRVRELLDRGAKAQIDALIAEDKALEAEANAIEAVDKLIRYHRDLDALLNNFVTFRDFYSKKRKALFQAGTLYLDGRSCELVVKVADAAAHATLATQSGTYLVYCDCTRKATGEKITIAAAMTGGDADDLMVGRNGIFYDRKGNDWDATIVKLIQHPISTREAFWLPYKRVAKLIGDQVEKFASSRDKEMHEKAATSIADTSKAAEAPHAAAPAPAAPAPAPAPASKPFEIGALAAIGLAIGAVGSAVAAVAAGFMGLSWWQMPLALAGVILAISGPSVMLAWLRLRRRNIGPLLDANGWAVNARARLNIPFGRSLTGVAALPPNAERSLDDPFADPKPAWPRVGAVVVLVGLLGASWHFGYLSKLWAKMTAPVPPAAASATPAASAAPAAPAK